MKGISVIGSMYYLTEVDGIQWRGQDYRAHNFIKSVKGEEFRGYFDIKIGGKDRRFDNSNKEEFVPILLRAVCNEYMKRFPEKATLVPIPNSNATIANKASFRSLELARTFAGFSNGKLSVVPALRWIKAKKKAHSEGGSRDPQVHFDNLKVVEKVEGPVVVFDDVRTSGSQIIASYRRLTEAGMNVKHAFVIGKATKDQHAKMVAWSEDDLDVEPSPFDFSKLKF